MKNVLIIAPQFFGYHKSVEQAFRNLGMNTRLVEVSYLYASPFERLEYYANKQKYFARKKQKLNQEILRIYDEFKPDLVFVVQEGGLYRDTLLKMKGAVKVVWMMDTINRNKRDYIIWDIVDHVFFFEKTDVEVLWDSHRIEGGFLPLALDETVYFPMERKEEIDLLFVGALYDDRVEMLKGICKTYPSANIQVYGIKNEVFYKRFYHRLFREYKKSFKNRNIEPAMVNKLYSQTKICLNIHHPQNKHGVNQRFFEISGSRSLQLVNNNDYISTNFSQDEILTFNSRDELMELTKNLMEGRIDTQEIAANAYKKVLANHTFTHRMKEVLGIINLVKTETSGQFTDKEW